MACRCVKRKLLCLLDKKVFFSSSSILYEICLYGTVAVSCELDVCYVCVEVEV